MLKTKAEIVNWLNQYGIQNYTINENLTIDMEGDILLQNKQISYIPIKFNKIKGCFYCYVNSLTNLEFCPTTVSGNFYCDQNRLTSLKFCPTVVGGHFDCKHNSLSSLEFCPQQVGGEFNCSNNNLTSLQYCPEHVGGDFNCNKNEISDLEFCPKYILGDFYCEGNEQLKQYATITEFDIIHREHKLFLAKKEILKLEAKFNNIEEKRKPKL